MAISKETLELAKRTADYVKTGGTEYAKVEGDFKKFVPKLEQAIKDESETMMKIYLPRVEALEGKIDDVIKTLRGAEMFVGELGDDKEFAETRFKVLEELGQKVSDMQKKSTSMLKAVRDVLKRGGSAKDAAAKSADEQLREVASLKDSVADLKKRWEQIRDDMPRQEAKAHKAEAAGKQKELTEARTTLIDYSNFAVGLPALKARIAKYQASHPDLDKELKAELTWMIDDITEMQDIDKQRADLVKELMKIGQLAPPAPAIDVNKALKVLGLPAGTKADLQKLLNGPAAAWEKGLDALGKKNEAEMTGKQMVTELKKQKVVP